MNRPEAPKARILIVDDSPASIHVMARALAPEFTATFALSGPEALALMAADDLPDMILLDLLMPDMDGYEVLHRLKAEMRTHDIPVIVITAANEPETESSALLAGASDFINKPVNPLVLRLRVGLHILLREREQALYRLNEEIRELAFYDSLTGLPNRRLLMDRLEQSASRRDCGALLFIDMDNFKTLNDTAGHAIGDLLLQQVARRLRGCIRQSDTVARIGGDEFVVVLTNLGQPPAVAAAQAQRVGEKILHALSEPYPLEERDYTMTSSIGVALVDHDHRSAAALLKGADLAMYKAKAAGRNTLRFVDAAPPDGPGGGPT